MNFSAFLSQAESSEFWANKKNFCFSSQEFPSLFFQTLFNHLEAKKILPAPRQKLDQQSGDLQTLIASLEQSFLGSTTFYWLGNIEAEKVSKANKQLLSYLVHYSGPNTLSFFISNETELPSVKNFDIITIDQSVNSEVFKQIQDFFGIKIIGKRAELAQKIFKESTTIPLDSACMLLHYLELLSAKMIAQGENYLLGIMGKSPSLSLLAEYFFAHNPEQFFRVWSSVEKEFPFIFWISFWAEQIWRAQLVIAFMNKQDFINAKKASFRLPYSFIKKDWQKYSNEHLSSLFQKLYDLDYAIKRGIQSSTFEIFYLTHFTATPPKNRGYNI